MDKFLALAQANFFKGLSDPSRKALADICFPREVKKKDVLFAEGDQGHSIYLLIRGNIQLHKTAPDGSTVVIKMVQPGEVFAEVILFESDRYPVTALALGHSLVLLFPKRDVLRLLSIEEFRNDFIAMLLRKQRYLAAQIFNLTTLDVEQRLFLFLRQHYGPLPRLQIDMSKKDLAAAIGTTPESLSRLILRLKKKKVFQWTGKTIVFKSGFWEKQHD